MTITLRIALIGLLGLFAEAVVAAAPERAAASAAKRIDTLVVSRSASPVMRAIERRLGRRLNLHGATRKRLARPRPYELAILDGDSIHSGGTTVVRVPKGASRATFVVETNDNALNPGQRRTAQITAFYTKPTVAQLTVEAK